MAQQTVRVQVISKDRKRFYDAVAYAKRLHGTFDSASQTWLIPASMAAQYLPDGAAHGLKVVEPADTSVEHCGRWTADQGCPLHGEVCR